MNPILLARTNVPIDDQLNVFLGNVSRDCEKCGTQDDREVYNVAHYAPDILLADRCERSGLDLETKIITYLPLYTPWTQSANPISVSLG